LPELRIVGELVPDDLDSRLDALRGHPEIHPAHATDAEPTP